MGVKYSRQQYIICFDVIPIRYSLETQIHPKMEHITQKLSHVDRYIPTDCILVNVPSVDWKDFQLKSISFQLSYSMEKQIETSILLSAMSLPIKKNVLTILFVWNILFLRFEVYECSSDRSMSQFIIVPTHGKKCTLFMHTHLARPITFLKIWRKYYDVL